MQNPLSNLINAKGWCVADGATGTNLFNRGLETGYPPELWSVERPDDVLWLHNEFLQAGSDLILTNSFGGTGFRLKLHNVQDRARALNIAASKLAREAVDTHFGATGKKAIVAGSIGPTGGLFEPLGHLTHSSAIAGFSEQADALAEGGVDVLWIETMSSNEEVAAAIEAAKATGLPICATMTFDTGSRSMMGVMPADFAEFVRGLGPILLELIAALVQLSCCIRFAVSSPHQAVCHWLRREIAVFPLMSTGLFIITDRPS
jgi:5-methyltetrahydrofolate--homocysteine methyltransferase